MENKELNLVEKLKHCLPQKTKLWSPLFGDCELYKVMPSKTSPIVVNSIANGAVVTCCFTYDGKLYDKPEAECLLYPSKDNRDWSTFNIMNQFEEGDFFDYKR